VRVKGRAFPDSLPGTWTHRTLPRKDPHARSQERGSPKDLGCRVSEARVPLEGP
jgi:hypothetical protein